MSISKSDLIASAANYAQINRTSAEAVVNVFLDELMGAVAAGDKVTIMGFGTFEPRLRPARTARNPRTGEPIPVEEKMVPVFKAGSPFKERVHQAMKAE